MLKAFSGCVVALLVGGAVLAPTPAKAWWVREGWRAPVVVVAPVVVAPRPIVVGPPVVVRGPIWVRPHYNRFGYFVPGHWR